MCVAVLTSTFDKNRPNLEHTHTLRAEEDRPPQVAIYFHLRLWAPVSAEEDRPPKVYSYLFPSPSLGSRVMCETMAQNSRPKTQLRFARPFPRCRREEMLLVKQSAIERTSTPNKPRNVFHSSQEATPFYEFSAEAHLRVVLNSSMSTRLP